MAKFIICSCENTEYRKHNQQNSPINIELVTQVSKFRECYYPDKEGAPAIRFSGINKIWVYSKDEEKERDLDYDKIINEN